MKGLSPKLPLALNSIDGIGLNKTFTEVAKQNLKMVLLTNPGERIMDPGFGVGILSFLFENNINQVTTNIRDTINSQVQEYLPYISIDEITIIKDSSISGFSSSTMSILLKYYIEPLDEIDTLEIN